MKTGSPEFYLALARRGRPVRHSSRAGYFLTSQWVGAPSEEQRETITRLEQEVWRKREPILAELGHARGASPHEVPAILDRLFTGATAENRAKGLEVLARIGRADGGEVEGLVEELFGLLDA